MIPVLKAHRRQRRGNVASHWRAHSQDSSGSSASVEQRSLVVRCTPYLQTDWCIAANWRSVPIAVIRPVMPPYAAIGVRIQKQTFVEPRLAIKSDQSTRSASEGAADSTKSRRYFALGRTSFRPRLLARPAAISHVLGNGVANDRAPRYTCQVPTDSTRSHQA